MRKHSGTRRTKIALGVLLTSVLGLGAQTVATSPARAAAKKPTATLSFAHAPIGQNLSATADLTPATATFSPAQKGAAVTIERYVNSKWTKATTGKQNSAGKFVFLADAGSSTAPYAFRARSTLGKTTVTSPTTRPSLYAVTWRDEFEAGVLSPEWITKPVGGSETNRACSGSSLTQTTVNGESANLGVLRDPTKIPNTTSACPRGQYLNAFVATQFSHGFTYGIFAARIRFENERGMHGSFWLYHAGLDLKRTPTGGNADGGPLPAETPIIPASADRTRTSWPAVPGHLSRPAAVTSNSCARTSAAQYGAPERDGAEIDVVEYFGDGYRDGGISNNIYWGGHDAKGVSILNRCGDIQPEVPGILGAGRTPSNGYHVYSVEWTPSLYIFRTDGYETFRTSYGVSGAQQYLLLSLLTSDWELPTLHPGRPALMNVDWVRAWQQ